MKFKIGDRVVKNPNYWMPSEFDNWGAGDGVGIIDSIFIEADSSISVDVRWPAGRCYQKERELDLLET